jgi:hypothetical protein
MSREVYKIIGCDSWLVEGKVINSSELSAVELQSLQEECKGELEPIFGNSKEEVVGVIL